MPNTYNFGSNIFLSIVSNALPFKGQTYSHDDFMSHIFFQILDYKFFSNIFCQIFNVFMGRYSLHFLAIVTFQLR